LPSFYHCNPQQAYLLPPSLRDVLRENRLCFLLSGVLEQFELSEFERVYGEEGHSTYHPLLMLKVWLYAYGPRVASGARRLQQCLEKIWPLVLWLDARRRISGRCTNFAGARKQTMTSLSNQLFF
jgi:hypothetical protein